MKSDLSLIISLFCLLAIINAKDTDRPAQVMPKTYRQGQQDADRPKYLELVRQNVAQNAVIPEKTDDFLRFISYNVHYFCDISETVMILPDVMKEINILKPTVIVFQEVPTTASGYEYYFPCMKEPHHHRFFQFLNENGYHVLGEYASEGLGNFVASKYPFIETRTVKTSYKRNVSEALVKIGNETYAIYGTHLEVKDDKTRLGEAQIIAAMSESKRKHSIDFKIILGDMNSYINDPPMRHLKQHGFVDAFALLGNRFPPPEVTCWAGTRIDFIAMSPALQSRILGAYVYYSVASDHLPIIVDVALASKSSGALSATANAKGKQVLAPLSGEADATIAMASGSKVNTHKKATADIVSDSAAAGAPKIEQSTYRRAQIMPKTYRTGDWDASWDKYVNLIDENLAQNAVIPPMDNTFVRLMSYNIHYFCRRDDRTLILDDVIKEISEIQPTIIVFQEVPRPSHYPCMKENDHNSFFSFLKNLGYSIVGEYTAEALGNFIATRIPLISSRTVKTSYKRNVSEALVKIGNETYAIYGTHLEVKDDKTRLGEAQIIAAMSESKRKHSIDFKIILGDMNSYINDPPMRHLKQHGFVDAFALLGNRFPPPEVTCWAGTRIDFIAMSPALQSRILGAYVYYSVASDHLPVIVDIALPKTENKPSFANASVMPMAPKLNASAQEASAEVDFGDGQASSGSIEASQIPNVAASKPLTNPIVPQTAKIESKIPHAAHEEPPKPSKTKDSEQSGVAQKKHKFGSQNGPKITSAGESAQENLDQDLPQKAQGKVHHEVPTQIVTQPTEQAPVENAASHLDVKPTSDTPLKVFSGVHPNDTASSKAEEKVSNDQKHQTSKIIVPEELPKTTVEDMQAKVTETIHPEPQKQPFEVKLPSKKEQSSKPKDSKVPLSEGPSTNKAKSTPSIPPVQTDLEKEGFAPYKEYVPMAVLISLLLVMVVVSGIIIVRRVQVKH